MQSRKCVYKEALPKRPEATLAQQADDAGKTRVEAIDEKDKYVQEVTTIWEKKDASRIQADAEDWSEAETMAWASIVDLFPATAEALDWSQRETQAWSEGDAVACCEIETPAGHKAETLARHRDAAPPRGRDEAPPPRRAWRESVARSEAEVTAIGEVDPTDKRQANSTARAVIPTASGLTKFFSKFGKLASHYETAIMFNLATKLLLIIGSGVVNGLVRNARRNRM